MFRIDVVLRSNEIRMSKKILIVDDHKIFRDALKSALESTTSNLKVTGTSSNGQEAIDFCLKNDVDLIVMDLNMPIVNGLEATKRIMRSNPDQKILVLTMQDGDEIIKRSIELGAKGFLNKSASIEELITAINGILKEGYHFDDNVSKILLKGLVEQNKKPNPETLFSNRELEIIQLICKEHSNREIGEELGVSLRTVENHRKSILHKIGAKNIVGIIMYAMKHKLVET